MGCESPRKIRTVLIDRVKTPGYYHVNRGWTYSAPGEVSFSAQQHLGIENSRIMEMRCMQKRSPTVLEVGIGQANTLAELKQRMPHIVPLGIDIYISDEARNRAKDYNLFLAGGNAEEMPLKANSIDALFSVQTYRYTCDKLNFISEAYRVLKPDGLALIEIGPAWSEYSTPGIQDIISHSGMESIFELDKIILFGRNKTTTDTRVLKISPQGAKKDLVWQAQYLGASQQRYHTESEYFLS